MKALLRTRDGPNIIGRLRNEIGVMSYLSGHPNLVGLQDVYEIEGHIFLVQELCAGGTLSDVMRRTQGPVSEERAASLFRGIVKSVLHCHQVRAGGGGGGVGGGRSPACFVLARPATTYIGRGALCMHMA